MKRRRLSAFILFVFLVSTFVGCGGSSKPAETPHPKTIEELQQAVQSILTREHVPGAGIALVDKVVLIPRRERFLYELRSFSSGSFVSLKRRISYYKSCILEAYEFTSAPS